MTGFRWENLDFVIGMLVGGGIFITTLCVWEQWWEFVPRRREPKPPPPPKPTPPTKHRRTRGNR